MLIHPLIFFPPPFDDNDIWVPITKIPNLRHYYYVNTYSQVYSAYSNKILKPCYNHAGYLVVSMNCIDGTRIQRKNHRLSMMEFCYIDGCEFLDVNHKDGIKENIHLSNLEWATTKENVIHAINHGLRKSWSGSLNPKSKISEKDVRVIYELFLNDYSINEIMNIVPNTNRDMIRNIILGYCWTKEFTDKELGNMRNKYYMCSSTIES